MNTELAFKQLIIPSQI